MAKTAVQPKQPTLEAQDQILIKGARTHNLKNVSVSFPRNKLIVVTGVSGSGKSSLTIDTLFAEGQRRYAESLSAYARQFMARMVKPDVDYIKGLCPAIAIEQKVITRTPRSTVGSMTEIYDYLRLLYARAGKTISPVHLPSLPLHLPHCLRVYCKARRNRELPVLRKRHRLLLNRLLLLVSW